MRIHANDTNKNKIIFAELSYTLNGIFYSVHNHIGRYGREKQYADAVEKLFKDNVKSI